MTTCIYFHTDLLCSRLTILLIAHFLDWLRFSNINCIHSLFTKTTLSRYLNLSVFITIVTQMIRYSRTCSALFSFAGSIWACKPVLNVMFKSLSIKFISFRVLDHRVFISLFKCESILAFDTLNNILWL